MATDRYKRTRFLVVGHKDCIPAELEIFLLHHGAQLQRHLTSLRSALATLRTEKFDCIFVESALEDGDGLILAPTIKRASPRTIAILISNENRWATSEAARQLGFDEIFHRDMPGAYMSDEVEALLQKLSPGSRGKSLIESRIHLLSIREREILMDIATGATTREIAMKRHNSEATVKSHLTSIYRKLDVRNRVEAIAALQNN